MQFRVLVWALIIVIWQSAGRWTYEIGLPYPSIILVELIQIIPQVIPHIFTTAKSAFLGMIIGGFIGIGFGLAFHYLKFIRPAFFGISLSLYAIPLVALAPILVILFPIAYVPTALSAITIIFPLSIIVEKGLANVAHQNRKLFAIYGASKWVTFKKLNFPYSLPSVISGFQLAMPWALLGAMLGEFAGGRWGIGVYMLGALGNGAPEQMWALALLITIISLLGFYLLARLRQKVENRLHLRHIIEEGNAEVSNRNSAVHFLLCLALVITMWTTFAWLSPYHSPLVMSPLEVVERFLTDTELPLKLFSASKFTIPISLIAIFCGVFAALIWAIVAWLWPRLGEILTSFLMVTQVVPLVAIIPLFVLTLGREITVTISIAIIALLFPGFVIISNRMKSLPHALEKIMQLNTKSKFIQLRLIYLPWSTASIFTAMRVTAPRALLAVMLAEYLATGHGIGFLMAAARGRLSFSEIWGALLLTVIFSLLFYFIAEACEKYFLRKFNVY